MMLSPLEEQRLVYENARSPTKRIHKILQLDEFEQNLEELMSFHEELRRDGYLYVECSEDVQIAIQNMLPISKEFFDLPVKLKKGFHSFDILEKKKEQFAKEQSSPPDSQTVAAPVKGPNPTSSFSQRLLQIFSFGCTSLPSTMPSSSHPIAPSSVVPNPSANRPFNRAQTKGYVNTEANPREFYDIGEGDRFQHKLFTQYSQEMFQIFHEIARLLFQELMYPFQCDPNYLNLLMSSPSNTKLRIIKYLYQGRDDKETCGRHTDMGLLTILPALSSGLELKTFQYPYQYLDVEAMAPRKPCLIIFAAEGLSRLTSGYFQAPIHRVVSTSFRYSMPFFFRSNSKEKIDLKSLQSMKLNQMIENGQLESLEGITAFDLEVLVQVQYKQKRIPAELGAYKQIPYYRQLFD